MKKTATDSITTEKNTHQPDTLTVTHQATHQVLDLIQNWLLNERLSSSRLVLITRGAITTNTAEDPPRPSQSPIWGLARSAQAENPERITLIDIDQHQTSTTTLPTALTTNEPQLAIRNGNILTPRLTRTTPNGVLVVPEGVSEWCLDVGGSGTLEDLSLVPAPEMAKPLGSGQVRVGVRAGGLNFRDVLIGLGMYPGEASCGW